jgi:membrane-associated phospholipid phosphatase
MSEADDVSNGQSDTDGDGQGAMLPGVQSDPDPPAPDRQPPLRILPGTGEPSRADDASPLDDRSPLDDPSPLDDAPASSLMQMIRSIDDRVDGWFEPLRGNPTIDGAAKLVTGLGDHGLMWAVTTAWRARHTGPERSRAVRALAVAGIESSLVNAAIKAVVGRSRPDVNRVQLAEGGVPIRQPKSSSFPSGHTLAAFCAATVMSTRGDRSGNTLLFSGAALVGISRLHVGAHHASDVLGGAAIGVGLGLLGRRLA